MRPIDADALKESLSCYPMLTNLMIRMFARIIDEQENIIIPAVTKGRWIPSPGEGDECSRCWGISKMPGRFCPTCGSQNSLERNDE